jgi:hypothetical protein
LNLISKAVVVLALFFTDPVRASDGIFERVRISYKESRSGKDSSERQKASKSSWVNGCRELGKTLGPQSNPWVYGVFDSFFCELNSKVVFGKKAKAQFSIEIVDSKSKMTISLFQHLGKRSSKTLLAQFNLDSTQNLHTFLQDKEFVDLLALSILESMPAAGLVSAESERLKGDKLFVRPLRKEQSANLKYNYPGLPAELIFFELRWDKKASLWKSNVVGYGKLASTKKEPAHYQLDDNVQNAIKSGSVFLHSSEGPVKASERWSAPLNDAVKDLDKVVSSGKFSDFMKGIELDMLDTLLSTAASGYVGFKYGVQVLPTYGELGLLLGKTRIVSVLVEIRSGPAKGLRYYYDLLPETKAAVTLTDGIRDEQYIGFARHILGYSFGLDFDSFIDRVTVDPKLGLWTFNARLPVQLSEDGSVARLGDFNLGSTYSIAIEFGLENISDWYVIRTWAGMDTGYSLVKTGGKISSYRFGIDAFLTAGPEIPFFGTALKTTWVLFYVFDHLDIRSQESFQLGVGEEVIKGLEYDAAYAGAGVALSW